MQPFSGSKAMGPVHTGMALGLTDKAGEVTGIHQFGVSKIMGTTWLRKQVNGTKFKVYIYFLADS